MNYCKYLMTHSVEIRVGISGIPQRTILAVYYQQVVLKHTFCQIEKFAAN